MTTEELSSKMSACSHRQRACMKRLMDLAPSLVDVLKDAGRASTAARVDEILFEYDAIDQEMAGFALENPDQVLSVLNKWMERG